VASLLRKHFQDAGDVAWVFLCLIESDWHMIATVAPTFGMECLYYYCCLALSP